MTTFTIAVDRPDSHRVRELRSYLKRGTPVFLQAVGTTGPEMVILSGIEEAFAAPSVSPPVISPSPSSSQRQRKAMIWWRRVFALMIAIPLVLALIMVTQHGPAFFVFRSAGTGFSPDFDGSKALTENQGPGQPDAPPVLTRTASVHRHVQLHVPAPAPPAAGVTFSSPSTGPATSRGLPFTAIAERQDGRWVALAAGASYAAAAAGASAIWKAHPGWYASEWVVIGSTS